MQAAPDPPVGWVVQGRESVATSCLASGAWIVAVVNDVQQVKEVESWEQ
jgi:hypothetical protein